MRLKRQDVENLAGKKFLQFITKTSPNQADKYKNNTIKHTWILLEVIYHKKKDFQKKKALKNTKFCIIAHAIFGARKKKSNIKSSSNLPSDQNHIQ